MSNDKLTVAIDGEDRELFMSYGLLTTLTRKVGNLERIPAIPLDDELRDDILKEVLAERTNTGKVTKAVEDLTDVDLTIEGVEAICSWVMENLTGFFVRSLVMAKKTLDSQTAATAQFSENG